MEYFLPNQKISAIHGEPKRISLRLDRGLKIEDRGEMLDKVSTVSDLESSTWKLVVLPLFHPAAALYNGSMRETLVDDFSRIPAIVTKLKETNKT